MSLFGVRPSKDVTWLRVCQELAKQATCYRRGVGCVLLDARGHVLSTGWNGVAKGEAHCNQFVGLESVAKVDELKQAGYLTVRVDDRLLGWYPNACAGAKLPSGTGLSQCDAIHAEQNALTSCRLPYEVHTCYITHSPCNSCVKQLLSSTCKLVVFIEEYADQSAKNLWLKSGRRWEQMPAQELLRVR